MNSAYIYILFLLSLLISSKAISNSECNAINRTSSQNTPAVYKIIELINKKIDDGRGKRNTGVYLVKALLPDSTESTLVLKLVHSEAIGGDGSSSAINGTPQTKITEYTKIHQLLGERGYATKIYRFYNYENLVSEILTDAGLRQSIQTNSNMYGFSFNSLYEQRHYGVLMEKMHPGLLLNRDGAFPDFYINWSKINIRKALKKLEEIKKFFLESNIQPHDLQLIATENGEVKVIDVDAFRFGKYDTNAPYHHALEKAEAKLLAALRR